jgi:hypothetical protein
MQKEVVRRHGEIKVVKNAATRIERNEALVHETKEQLNAMPGMIHPPIESASTDFSDDITPVTDMRPYMAAIRKMLKESR